MVHVPTPGKAGVDAPTETLVVNELYDFVGSKYEYGMGGTAAGFVSVYAAFVTALYPSTPRASSPDTAAPLQRP